MKSPAFSLAVRRIHRRRAPRVIEVTTLDLFRLLRRLLVAL